MGAFGMFREGYAGRSGFSTFFRSDCFFTALSPDVTLSLSHQHLRFAA